MSDSKVYEGACVFCTGKVRFDAADCIAQHSVPPCAKFIELDALAFVIEHRRALGIPAHPKDRS